MSFLLENNNNQHQTRCNHLKLAWSIMEILADLSGYFFISKVDKKKAL